MNPENGIIWDVPERHLISSGELLNLFKPHSVCSPAGVQGIL